MKKNVFYKRLYTIVITLCMILSMITIVNITAVGPPVVDGVISPGEYSSGMHILMEGPWDSPSSPYDGPLDGYLYWDNQYLWIAVNEPVPEWGMGGRHSFIEFMWDAGVHGSMPYYHAWVLWNNGDWQYVRCGKPIGCWSTAANPFPGKSGYVVGTATEMFFDYTDYGTLPGDAIKLIVDSADRSASSLTFGNCQIWPYVSPSNPDYYPCETPTSVSTWGDVTLGVAGPPFADAGGPYGGSVGASILLDGTGSYDIGGTIVSYEWDLDNDGLYDDATGPTTTHSWSSEGSYTISLKVTDNDGFSDTDDAVVNIGGHFVDGIITPGEYDCGMAVTLTDDGFTVDGYIDWDSQYLYVAVDEPNPGYVEFAFDAGSHRSVYDVFTIFSSGTTNHQISLKPPIQPWSGAPYIFTAVNGAATELKVDYTDFGIALGDTIIMCIERGASPNAYWPAGGVIWNNPPRGPEPCTWGYVTLSACIQNRPPVADANGPYVVNEGTAVLFNAGSSYDPDGDPLQYRWDFNNDGIWDTEWSSSPTASFTWCDNYTGFAMVNVSDGSLTDTDTAQVTVNNVAPTADFGNDGPKDENSPVTVSFTNMFDPGCDTLYYSFDWDNDGVYDIVNQTSPTATHIWCDNGIYTVKGMIKDDDGGYNEYTTDVMINNVAPNVEIGPDETILVGSTFSRPGSFTDPGCDNWSATVDYGDGTGIQPLILTGQTFQLDHTYNNVGVFTLTVTITDDDGGVGTDSLIVTVLCVDPIYVDDDYTTSTPGYGIDHVPLLQTALNNVCPGGTVYVFPGNYGEGINYYDAWVDGISIIGMNIPLTFDITTGNSAIITLPLHITGDDITVNYLVFNPSSTGAVVASGDNIIVQYNKFLRGCISNPIGIENLGQTILDARYNWWGRPDGPSGDTMDANTGRIADGLGVKIVNNGPVLFDPWAGIDAVAKASKTTAEVGESIMFSSSDSFAAHFDGTSNDYDVFWDFDDGYLSQQKQTAHAFDTPGIYQVQLRIQSQDPQLWGEFMFDWDYLTITVVNPGTPLEANADGSNLGGYETTVDEPIQLYGIATGGTPPYTYDWDLGDGTYSDQQNPIHTYKEPGTYIATFKVTDDTGMTDTDTTEVLVHDIGELLVKIIVDENTITGASTLFTATVTGGVQPYSFNWDFGDGTISSDPDPTHEYEEPGIYTVTLTVSDINNQKKTDTITITVEEGDSDIIPAEIKKVTGGFKITAKISAGSMDCNWNIKVQANYIILGGEASGIIEKNKEETVKCPLTIGIGKADITVSAGDIQKQYTGFALGPLFLNLQEV